jgi:hypothetical protein
MDGTQSLQDAEAHKDADDHGIHSLLATLSRMTSSNLRRLSRLAMFEQGDRGRIAVHESAERRASGVPPESDVQSMEIEEPTRSQESEQKQDAAVQSLHGSDFEVRNVRTRVCVCSYTCRPCSLRTQTDMHLRTP